jgi:hypothetical protein
MEANMDGLPATKTWLRTEEVVWRDAYNAALGGLCANPSHDPMGAVKVAEQVADKALESFKRRWVDGRKNFER